MAQVIEFLLLNRIGRDKLTLPTKCQLAPTFFHQILPKFHKMSTGIVSDKQITVTKTR